MSTHNTGGTYNAENYENIQNFIYYNKQELVCS